MVVNERKKIEDRIRKKESEIQDLEMRLRDSRVYIQAMQEVLKMLPRDGGSSAAAEVPITLRDGSLASLAREGILEKGKPLHVSELLGTMGKEDNRDNRTSLSGTLAAYVRKGEVFTRPAPNRFGLIELGHKTVASVPTEPPDDFGDIENDT